MLSAILLFVLLFALLPTVTFANSGISVTVDGQPVVFADQAPVIVDGRTLVPVAGVFQALGFDVRWEAATSQVILFSEANFGTVVELTIGSSVFGVAIGSNAELEYLPLDVPAQIIGGRTMLPIAAVLRSVGYNVGWDDATRTVLITPTVAEAPELEMTYTPLAPPDFENAQEVVEEDSESTHIPAENEAGLNMTVWLPQTRNRIYHSINNCGRMNPDRATAITREYAHSIGYQACSRCW